MQLGQLHRHYLFPRRVNLLALHVYFVMKWAIRKSSEKLLHLDWIKKVKDCARVLGDKTLLSKLSTGDLISINAVYHRACLTRLYRRVEAVGCDTTESHNTQVM